VAGFLCRSCGYQTAKWMGFCPQCGAGALDAAGAGSTGRPQLLVAVADSRRLSAGLSEVDRVLGGGVVPGAVVLLGGEPGVGKSTLALQWAGATRGHGPVLIVSGEESAHQVGMRAERIGCALDDVLISSASSAAEIVEQASKRRPALVIVDSIQTVDAGGAAVTVGGPAQVREAAAQLVAFSKQSAIPVVLIGHVTKDGSIAGPKLLEHMVDVVLYLQGDPDAGIRFLRSSKNRFGSVNEVGVFEMTEAGLIPVPDPSELLVAHRDETAPGSVLFPAVDGRRAILVEVQALTVATKNPQPRRNVKGVPPARLHQVLAVLERHCGLPIGDHDVYLSVMGGARITEPAADLPIAVAVASSLTAEPVGSAAAWGEVGLTGELRSVVRSEARRAEVERFMVTNVAAPGRSVRRIGDVLAMLGLAGDRARRLDVVR